eukprot:CAMPEP_0198249476 /NCGR_PEP_ID=MMETSP1447-20131203/994_1 /TAXON_ID=420782 /ORGANISM="Chaetoceros dichaeta, Strain CCMP1751" /LENGTH=337 /DNA_ID=CAMNT_0043934123 /DNA_START=59 /DNA_END=1069 /DNA_ORIENTATION=+
MEDEAVTEKTSSRDDMSPAGRLAWLRERGVTVETSDDRKRDKISKIMKEEDEVDGEEYDDLSFVLVPQDDAIPLKELTMKVSKNKTVGDGLMEHLKPFFSAFSKKVDLDLLKTQATKHFGSGDGPGKVSEKSLMEVAEKGQVESFCLVQPTPSNKWNSIYMYLDEVGMLKRLPLNTRAADFARKAGFTPAPMFYGDIFIGRMSNKPVMKNVDFKLGLDTSPDAAWLKTAVMENLEHRTAMNGISGSHEKTQPSADGEDGVAKAELGGLYEWTQTDEEVEIVVPLNSSKDEGVLTSKAVKMGGLKVKYYPRRLLVSFRDKELLSLDFYAGVDPDGCMW